MKGASMKAPNAGRRQAHYLPTLRRRVVILMLLTSIIVAGLGTMAVAQQPDCTNLVTDSSLENGNGWATTSNGTYALLGDYLARTGTKSAHLAGVDNANDQLSRALALPADRPAVTLRFWWQINSEEESNEFDGLTVLIADAAGNALRSVLTLGSDSAANQWQQSVVDLSAFAGQSIQLKFVAQTDETLVTDFFIDDIEVEACAAVSQGFRQFLPMVNR
jgi:hypothetical protein